MALQSWKSTVSRPLVDLLIAGAGFLLLFVLAGSVDLAEAWQAFAMEHEDLELDEIPMAISLLTVSFGWFAWRRWQEFKAESLRCRRLNEQLEEELRLRIEIQDGLVRARHEAQAADRAKTEFLANMSHELRTPLNATIGFAELMENEVHGPVGNAAYKDYVVNIRESGRHLLGLINDILDLSKIEAGKMELQETVFQLSEVVDAALLLVTPQAGQLEIALGSDLPAALPRLRGDPRLVKQILTNLLSNAVKFSHVGGEVCLSITAVAGQPLVMKVRDRGVGMTPEEITVALMPFGQVDSAFSRTRGGTGLGLPMVNALVDLHGGDLVIDSLPGQGTEVSVTLPEERIVWSEPGRSGAAAVA